MIVLRAGASADAGDIRAHLSKQFVKWMVPDAYVFVDAIRLDGSEELRAGLAALRPRDLEP